MTDAPTGNRAVDGLDFGAGFLRMGANAKAADHPGGSKDPTGDIA